jgi:hypothetical protein
MEFIIQNIETNGYLDGGPKHMRHWLLGKSNSGWITWQVLPREGKESLFLIKNTENGGYLDGGPNHLRPFNHGNLYSISLSFDS